MFEMAYRVMDQVEPRFYRSMMLLAARCNVTTSTGLCTPWSKEQEGSAVELELMRCKGVLSHGAT